MFHCTEIHTKTMYNASNGDFEYRGQDEFSSCCDFYYNELSWRGTCVSYEKSLKVFCTGGNLMLQRDEGRGRRVHKALNHSHLLAGYAGHHYNGCVRPQSQTLEHLCKQQWSMPPRYTQLRIMLEITIMSVV